MGVIFCSGRRPGIVRGGLTAAPRKGAGTTGAAEAAARAAHRSDCAIVTFGSRRAVGQSAPAVVRARRSGGKVFMSVSQTDSYHVSFANGHTIAGAGAVAIPRGRCDRV